MNPVSSTIVRTNSRPIHPESDFPDSLRREPIIRAFDGEKTGLVIFPDAFCRGSPSHRSLQRSGLKLYRNLNYIRVRSFILGGAPLHSTLPATTSATAGVAFNLPSKSTENRPPYSRSPLLPFAIQIHPAVRRTAPPWWRSFSAIGSWER
jgi:hypothetical protein